MDFRPAPRETARAGKNTGIQPGQSFMHSSVRSPAIQHLAAVLLVGAAALLSGFLWNRLFPDTVWPLFLIAIAVSAFIGGLWTGLTATLASFLAIGALVWLLRRD